MDAAEANAYFNRPEVLAHYVRATANVGLWQSEELIFRRLFKPDERLLELGTGAGRIALGLEELGYQHIMAIDLSKGMVEEARRMGRAVESRVVFQHGDATRLVKFLDGEFDGAIFGFNGLMMIPGRQNRIQAMREIRRVIRPGGWFTFTSHDRELSKHRSFWAQQRYLWNAGEQDPELIDFGDRWEDTPLGRIFIHIPTSNEVREDLKAAGWRIETDVLRSQIATESLITKEFSDECRFWIAQNGAGKC